MGFADLGDEIVQLFFRQFRIGDCPQKHGQFGEKRLVGHHRARNGAPTDVGLGHEILPGRRLRLQAQLLTPARQGGFVLGGRIDPTLDLAPIAGIVAMLLTKLPEGLFLRDAQAFDAFSEAHVGSLFCYRGTIDRVW